jgi:Dihydroorotate dehydrogenase
MYHLIKKVLFRYDPEKVHEKVMKWLTKTYNLGLGRRYLESNFSYLHPSLEKEVMGLRFKNPVGLAAGFDKDAKYIDELACWGLVLLK